MRFTFFLLLLLPAACTPGPTTPDNTTSAPEPVAEPVVDPELAPVVTNNYSSTYEELEASVGIDGIFLSLSGKWQSLDDPAAMIEFQPGKLLEYYNGELLSTTEFTSRSACDALTEDFGPYFVLADERCLYLVSIGDELQLSNVARGNTLRYKHG